MEQFKPSRRALEILAATISVANHGSQPSEEELDEIMTCYWNLLDRMIRKMDIPLDP